MSKLAELQEQRNKAATTLRKLGDKFTANGKKWETGEAAAWDAANAEDDRTRKAMSGLQNDAASIVDRLAEVDRMQNGVDEDLARAGLPDARRGEPRETIRRERPTFTDAAGGRVSALFNNERICRPERGEEAAPPSVC